MEVYPNHIGMMFTAFYNALQIQFTIDGITFTLFNVLEASLLFFVVNAALREYWHVFDRIGD